MSGDENEYQFQSPHVGFAPQVLPEVEAIHILVDKTKRVYLSRVHPHEWHHLHISVVKKGARANFIVKPLQGDYQRHTGHVLWLQRTEMI